MAVTKIIALKGRLKDCLNYTSNPEKTYAATDGKELGPPANSHVSKSS